MTTSTELDQARAAFARHAWGEATSAYAAADREGALGATDLGQAGLAAHLIGDDDAATALMTRGHQMALGAGNPDFAAHLAFWLGMMFANRGDFAVAGGWLARAQRVVEENHLDSVVSGYLLVPQALRLLDEGNPSAAFTLFEQAATIAERFQEADLATLSRLGRGQSLIDTGEIERGVAFLDDAMLAVTSGEVGPVVNGIVYCASIESFHALYDLRRAQGWTDALSRWCAEQPDMVPFRGRCLVYRAELMRFHGAWSEANEEARRAEQWLLRPPPEAAVGEAYFLQAELLRLRGDLDAAESAYREAAKWGRRPESGLAMLRLAQGRANAGLTMLRRALDESRGGLARAPLLAAQVEIAIASGDIDVARTAANELAALTEKPGTPLLNAIATRAHATVRLAAGEAEEALGAFRRSWDFWQPLDAPYESARVRVGIALACRRLGDEDTAAIELAAAREVFERLGAALDVREVDEIVGTPPPTPGGLSAREVEVLREVARGGTNREIAAALGISERTVDRHVSNIYTKLDISSRAAATAFAYEHGLA